MGSVIAGCGSRRGRPLSGVERASTADGIEQFIAWRLAPAQVAPPTLAAWGGRAAAGRVAGEAQLTRAEEAPWNAWPGPTARLFNNRAAHLFQIEVQAPGPVRWVPERTTLELNHPGHALRAAPTQEVLLEELVFWAYHQERQVLDGDLVARARGAGALRDAYLPRSSEDGHLTGLLAFPLVVTEANVRFVDADDDLADLHVVAMRLTLGVEGPDGPATLVWELE